MSCRVWQGSVEFTLAETRTREVQGVLLATRGVCSLHRQVRGAERRRHQLDSTWCFALSGLVEACVVKPERWWSDAGIDTM